jgi:excisionase family DNA binding protein
LKLPPIIITEEEILQAQEEADQRLQDWLDRQQQVKQERKSAVAVPPKLLSTKQAARYLSMSEWQLRNLVRNGEVPYVPGKYWKFDVADLDRWITEHRERRTL